MLRARQRFSAVDLVPIPRLSRAPTSASPHAFGTGGGEIASRPQSSLERYDG
jgi:hypothetical protein